MENKRFWDESFHKNLRMANTSKNYTSKPQSAYNNVPLHQISINMENIRFCLNFEKLNTKIVTNM